MAKINWTYEAECWLKDIHDYIVADNPTAADRVVREIYDKAQILLSHPQIGYRYNKLSTDDVRILLYGHYRIVYLIKTSGDIDIVGIFHGALDIDKYLSAEK